VIQYIAKNIATAAVCQALKDKLEGVGERIIISAIAGPRKKPSS
jgi:hypothetical protein